jgi:hypothetical protein
MHLKETVASRIITTYCRKIHDRRMYADDFNKKLKAGITPKVEYHAFELCNALLYKQVYAAFKKKFPEITDIAFGVTKTHIYVKQTNRNKTIEYYAIENTKHRLFEEVTEDCKKPKIGGTPMKKETASLDREQIMDIIENYSRRAWGHGTETSYKSQFQEHLMTSRKEAHGLKAADFLGYQCFLTCTELADAMSKVYPDIKAIDIGLTVSHFLVRLVTFTKSKKSVRAPVYFAVEHDGIRTYNDIMDKNPQSSDACAKKARPWLMRWLPF